VSSHFLVRRDGALLQFVPVHGRAWHAGVSAWRRRERCNDFSIGIELEGTDDGDFDPAQYRRLRELVHALRAALPLRDIAAHSDVGAGAQRPIRARTLIGRGCSLRWRRTRSCSFCRRRTTGCAAPQFPYKPPTSRVRPLVAHVI